MTLLFRKVAAGVLFSALASLPVVASQFKLDFNNDEYKSQLKFGGIKPKLVTEGKIKALRFESSATTASSAIAKNIKPDFSKGMLLQLKFKANLKQSNSYPRLIDQPGSFSIHLAESNSRQVKFLVNGKGGKYVQAIDEIADNDTNWHQLTAVYDAQKKTIMLQLDNKPVITEKVDFQLKKSVPKPIIIGARKLNGSARGFNGAISSVSITSPYKYNKNVFKGAILRKNIADDTSGMTYTTVCAIPGRHMAFPGVTKMPNGDLAAVFREGAGHICPYGRICVVYSKDGGKNWSAPVSVLDTESDERDPSILTLPDGRVLITAGGWNSWMASNYYRKKFDSETQYITQAGEKNFGGSRFIFSSDNGKTWSKPVKAAAFCPHGPLYYKGKFYNPTLKTDRKNTKRHVAFYEGDKNGKTWKRLGNVGTSEYAKNVYGKAVYEEPHTIALQDGTFLTAIRVPSDGYMRTSFSKDQGKTWSEPVKTKVRGYPQHLLQLKDGRILATYGYRYRPYGIRACISKDGGKTWDLDNEIIIRRGGKSVDLGYPVSIELDNGKVLAVYYYITQDRKDCFIEGAFFKP